MCRDNSYDRICGVSVHHYRNVLDDPNNAPARYRKLHLCNHIKGYVLAALASTGVDALINATQDPERLAAADDAQYARVAGFYDEMWDACGFESPELRFLFETFVYFVGNMARHSIRTRAASVGDRKLRLWREVPSEAQAWLDIQLRGEQHQRRQRPGVSNRSRDSGIDVGSGTSSGVGVAHESIPDDIAQISAAQKQRLRNQIDNRGTFNFSLTPARRVEGYDAVQRWLARRDITTGKNALTRLQEHITELYPRVEQYAVEDPEDGEFRLDLLARDFETADMLRDKFSRLP